MCIKDGDKVMTDTNFTPEFDEASVDTDYGSTGGNIVVPTFNKEQPFRFWCQKALPLVYDDALSYYELLCRVVAYLNNMMSDINAVSGSFEQFAEQFVANQQFLNDMAEQLGENTQELQDYINDRMDDFVTAYNELQSYVNDYFDNLDVQEEINNKLDEMASDGSLSDLLVPITQAWLDNATATMQQAFEEMGQDIHDQNSAIATQNGKISVLEGRMDTFSSLPSGSTSGNAELLDIRTNFLGETFGNAGDAVRASDLIASGFNSLPYTDDVLLQNQVSVAFFDVTKYKGGRCAIICNNISDNLIPVGSTSQIWFNDEPSTTGATHPENDEEPGATHPISNYLDDYIETVTKTYTDGLGSGTDAYRLLVTFEIKDNFEYQYIGVTYRTDVANAVTPNFIIYGSTWDKTPVDETLTQEGEAADAKATGNAIDNLKSDLSDVTGVDNLVKNVTYVNGYGISADGTISSNTGYRYIDNISVESLIAYRFCFASIVASSNTVRVHGYDSEGTWVAQLWNKTFSTVTSEITDIVIPSNVSYIKISLSKTQAEVKYIYKNYDLQKQINIFRDDINDRFSVLETKKDLSSIFESGYRTLNVSIGQTVSTSITSNSSFKTYMLPVRCGDRFRVTGYGGNASRTYGITDKNLKLLENSPANTLVIDHTIYIVEDGYAIFNYDVHYAHSLIYNAVTIDYKIEELKTVELTDWKYGYIKNKGTIGSAFTGTEYSYSSTWRFQFLRVHNGEHYTLTATGGSSAVPYCLLDDTNNCIAVGESNKTYKDLEIDVTADGYMIINALVTSPYKLTKKVIDDYSESFEPSFIPDIFEPVQSVAFNSDSLYSYDQIIDGYDSLVTSYPNNVVKTLLGNDESDTYPIYKYEFTPTVPTLDGYQTGMGAKFLSSDFPIVFMDACIHGDEPPCARALLNLITKIYTSDDTSIFSWLKNHVKFIIIPVANPYGYVNNTRGNANGVDLNRNFTLFWNNGSSDSSSEVYRGVSPLSEKEAEYIDAILQTLKDKDAFYYNWHTHGVWQSYEKMTCYSYPLTGDTFKSLKIANDLIPLITNSGHANHELPLNSGFIGVSQVNNMAGTSAYQASLYGIPSACPEVMYKYYDGSYGIDYSTKVNCMNLEYMLIAVTEAYKYLIA